MYFDAEKVQDAGGLLREWIHLIVKELGRKEAGFSLGNYKITDKIMNKKGCF